ncbi:MAG: serine hydrolase, partial [Longimicrobiales bacterium]
MTSTQWRDDYTRIVRGRSIAYAARREGGFSTDMPFEDVHGNGGLLTTVGDLLIWNQNLETGKLGGPAFLLAMQRQMRLNNGREIEYASGLYVSQRNGVREVYHTGSTAGYRAFLARYPDQRLSVALLCNIGSVNPGGVGRQVADVFLPQPVRTQQPEPPRRVAVPVAELNTKAGLYRDARTGEPRRFSVENGTLRMGNAELIPIGRSEFQQGSSGRRFIFETILGGRGPARAISADGDTTIYEPVAEFAPSPADLAEYAGEYYSPDAETTLNVVVENGRLVAKRRPDTRIALTPVYPGAFDGQLGLIRFIRGPSGRIAELSVRQARVYDLRFSRVAN